MLDQNRLRQCLLPPIPSVLTAASLLDQAGNAILADDMATANRLIADANIPEIWSYARLVMGKHDLEIHRYRRDITFKNMAKDTAAARMPDSALTLAIHRRDGFRCRYCKAPVMLSDARRAMMRIAPDALPWPEKDQLKHAAFYALTAVVDHLVPHARGGTNDPDNLVTSCQSCNYGKGNYLIEELELLDPRDRTPIVDEWDGLYRLLKLSVFRRSAEAAPPPPKAKKPPVKCMDPLSAMERVRAFQPEHAEQLEALLHRCVVAGAEWYIGKVLLLCLRTGSTTMDIVGINEDGTIEIPWMLTDHKALFHPFVERLAGAVSDAEIYQTKKGWWRIRTFGRKLTLAELLAIADTLVLAITELRATVSS